MAVPSAAVATTAEMMAAEAEEERHGWKQLLTGPGLIVPALVITILFSLIPLIYVVIVSFTEESTFFFHNPIYTVSNYSKSWNRYLPTVWTTVYLAALSTLVDLVFGYPFAYILIRRVRYRELVRTLMTFPLFGPLYLSFGLHFILLPGGPFDGVVTPVLNFFGLAPTDLLYSLWSVLFGMAVFTFPFMVMNIGAALSNVDPTLEEAATTLGARPWQTFWRVLFPLSRSGILAGFLMCFGWNLGVYVVPILLGTLREQRVLAIVIQTKALGGQFDYGLASALGIVLMGLAFTVTWMSLKFSRGALGA
jgi:ABC-type spermidine/putrescine transport system permease subunit I